MYRSIGEPDSDVLNEKNLVKSLDLSDHLKYSLLLSDLTKYYDKYLAVNQLDLAVKRYVIFSIIWSINLSFDEILTGDGNHGIS